MSDDLQERVALLPCPFCGGRGIDNASASLPYVYCESCDARGTECDTLKAAFECWNTRVSALAEMGGVRVKPLEWDDKVCEPVDNGVKLHFGPYTVRLWSGKLGARLDYLSQPLEVFPNSNGLSAEVKAAANEHHRSRILAVIEPAPVSVREAALRDAAKWFEDHENGYDRLEPASVAQLLRAIAEGKE